MSGSTTGIPQILSSQSQKEVMTNALFRASSSGMVFGINPDTTTALTWGVLEGVYLDSGAVPNFVANQTIALTANASNYLTLDGGVLTKVTAEPGWWPGPSGTDEFALYKVVTGSATVTSWEDWRVGVGSPGPQGPPGPPDEAWVTISADTSGNVNTDASLSHNFYLLNDGDYALTNPTNMVDGMVLNWLIKQDGTGTQTLTYGSKFKFANGLNTLSTPANSVDLISGMYHSSLDLIFCTLAKAFA